MAAIGRRGVDAALAAAFVASNAADAATTLLALRRGHREGNPIMRVMMRRAVVNPAIAFKLASVAVLAGTVYLQGQARMLRVPSLVFGAAALSNAILMWRKRERAPAPPEG
ncbi:MAG: hypothetical protein FJ318_10005 [SAR202 cluster bacterium]|nr:hypothetical protein [SAR202 cluster bacterium]